MKHRINPNNDYAFKRCLTDIVYEHLLAHFVNAFINSQSSSEQIITGIKLKDLHLQRKYEQDKLFIADILATDDQGNSYQIEMQKTSPDYLGDRISQVGSRLFCTNMKKSQTYDTLKKSHSIWLLTQNLFDDNEFYRDGTIVELKNYQPLTNKSCYHIVEMTKWKPPSKNQTLHPKDIWLYLFTSGGDFERIPTQVKNHNIMRDLMNILTDISDSEENYTHYLAVEEAERVRLTEKALREKAEAKQKETEIQLELMKQKLRDAGIEP